MKKERYQAGDTLCDMHDGFKYLPDNLEVVTHVKFRTDKAREIVNELSGLDPHNKMLTVVYHDGSYGHWDICGVYTYDLRYFGVVTLRYKLSDTA